MADGSLRGIERAMRGSKFLEARFQDLLERTAQRLRWIDVPQAADAPPVITGASK